jgi:hypothetical protein
VHVKGNHEYIDERKGAFKEYNLVLFQNIILSWNKKMVWHRHNEK